MDELMTFAQELQSTEKKATVFTSMKMETREEKTIAYKAMSNPDKKIKDMINLKINIKDVYCETVQIADTNTGEMKETPRIVFIDDKGVSYQSVSMSIYNALKRLITVFGPPTWDPPIPVTVKQVGKDAKQVYTLDII